MTITAAHEARLTTLMEAGILAAGLAEHPDLARVLPTMTPQERARLVADGARARDELALAHRGLAYRIAHEAAGRHRLPREELAQEALVALVEAVDHFRDDRGTTLGQFIAASVRRRVWRACLTRCGELHVTAGQAARLRRSGEEPRAALAPVSLAAGEREWDLPASSPDPEPSVPRLLAHLPPRIRTIIAARYGIGQPPRSKVHLARDLGISERQVRQLTDEGLRMLRSHALVAAA